MARQQQERGWDQTRTRAREEGVISEQEREQEQAHRRELGQQQERV